MFCKNCGSSVDEDAKFCEQCGAAVKQKKSVLPKLFAVAVFALVGILLIAILILNRKPTIHLNDYIEIQTEGYEGYGVATVSINWNRIKRLYGSKLKFTKSAEQEYSKYANKMTPIAALENHIRVYLDQGSFLSNGDTVTVSWDIDSDLSEILKCKFTFQDDEYKVWGLTEVDRFDPFADLSVNFSGIAPEVTALIDYRGEVLTTRHFVCDKTEGLHNGDTIVVRLSNLDPTYYAEKYNCIPERLSCVFTVSGAEAYVEHYSDLDAAATSDLKNDAQEYIRSYIKSDRYNPRKISEPEYMGYILSTFGGGKYHFRNSLYYIYKATVSHEEGRHGDTEIYFPVCFDDIVINSEGKYSSSSYAGIAGTSFYKKKSLPSGISLSDYSNESFYSTKGYLNPALLYQELSNGEKKVECGDGFEKYVQCRNVKKVSDISEPFRQMVLDEAKSKIETYVGEHYSGGSRISDLSYVGEYLLSPKDEDEKRRNGYFVIYSAIVSNDNNHFEPTTVYFPVSYMGVTRVVEDEYIVDEYTGICGYSNLPNSTYYTEGYIDWNEMHRAIVTSNEQKYDYDLSDGIKRLME